MLQQSGLILRVVVLVCLLYPPVAYAQASQADGDREADVAARFAPVVIQEVSGFRDRTGRGKSEIKGIPRWTSFIKDIPMSAAIATESDTRCPDMREVTCNSAKIERIRDSLYKG